MENDNQLLADILRSAAKLLAQESLRIRYKELGSPFSGQCQGTLNAAVRCQMLAERYGAEKLS
jgi:hypothetical protein